MSEFQSLLPGNATDLMLAHEEAAAPSEQLVGAVDFIKDIKRRRLPSFVPALIWEYGLSQLQPYVPNVNVLLEEGRQWQIERDTYAALDRGLGWIGMSAVIVEAYWERVWWNAFQLDLASLPAADSPDLDRIENITRLSVPFQSDFRRATWGYDAPAAELDGTRYDDSIFDDESGVRLRPGGPLWSFGRAHEIAYTLTQADGEALGNWIPPSSDASLTWQDAHIAWQDAHFPWSSSAAQQRRIVLATWFEPRSAYVALLDGAGAVIGYRCARGVHRVAPVIDGLYRFAGTRYSPAPGGELIWIEAFTDAGDGAPATVASVALVIGAAPAAGIPPGRLWLQAGQLAGGVEIARTPVSFPLRATVRERIPFLMRF